MIGWTNPAGATEHIHSVTEGKEMNWYPIGFGTAASAMIIVMIVVTVFRNYLESNTRGAFILEKILIITSWLFFLISLPMLLLDMRTWGVMPIAYLENTAKLWVIGVCVIAMILAVRFKFFTRKLFS